MPRCDTYTWRVDEVRSSARPWKEVRCSLDDGFPLQSEWYNVMGTCVGIHNQVYSPPASVPYPVGRSDKFPFVTFSKRLHSNKVIQLHIICDTALSPSWESGTPSFMSNRKSVNHVVIRVAMRVAAAKSMLHPELL